MSDQIQLNHWYKQNGLHYRFDEFSRKTNAVVRGDVCKLKLFVHQLDIIYHEGGSHDVENIESILQRVLQTGKAETDDPICFGDDRIRLIRRMDDSKSGGNQEGPLIGNPNYVEVTHIEQYGGKWPVKNNPPKLLVDGSRADMIYKVTTALGKVK